MQEYYEVGLKTPLHYAVENNSIEIVNLLLDYGADPQIVDKRGMSCLHYAARHGLKDMVVLLLNHGVDINLRDCNGFNASYWAELNNHKELLSILPPPKSVPPEDYTEFKL